MENKKISSVQVNLFLLVMIIVWQGATCMEQNMLEQGIQSFSKNNFNQALTCFLSLLEQNNYNLLARYNAGITYSLLGNYQEACNHYQILYKHGMYDADFFCNYGFSLKKLGHHQQALACYQQALTITPELARAHRGLAHQHLMLGNFEEGFKHYEWRWLPLQPGPAQAKKYLQDHSNFDQRTILLKTEYGLGDNMQFIRYAAILKKLGARIILSCNPKLAWLFSCCPYIDIIIPENTELPHDFQIFIMSCPVILDTRLSTIPASVPYLYANSTLVAYWQKKIAHDPNYKIGICWQADIHSTSNNSIVQRDAAEKSIPLAMLIDNLSKIPGISLYSLQKINGLEQLNNLSPELIIHHFDDIDNEHGCFMDTAALMHHLDLIITIDTSIAHLAGALGRPVWLLLPFSADWRWLLDRQDCPWYPTMRIFRQSHCGNWQNVMQQVTHELIHNCSQS